MARFVLKTPVITVNGVDLSDHCSEAIIETTRAEVDITSFGAANTETIAGIGDATITCSFFQDYAAGKVDNTLWALSTSDTPFTVTLKATNSAVGATNPRFDMSCLLFTYTPMGGAIGSASVTSVTFRNAAATGLTRNVV